MLPFDPSILAGPGTWPDLSVAVPLVILFNTHSYVLMPKLATNELNETGFALWQNYSFQTCGSPLCLNSDHLALLHATRL